MKRTLNVVIFLFLCTVVSGQEHRIESIGLTLDSTIPERIVLSESLLGVGETYSREDLDQALYRIRRVPFVFSASYTLEPISGSDGYALVFKVSDERAFFYEIEAVGSASEDDETGSARGGIGGRMYVPGGALEGTLGNFSASGSDASQSLGLTYRGFGLFGTGISTVVGLNQDFISGRDDRPTFNLGLEIPISLRQSIQSSATRLESSRTGRFGPGPGDSVELDSEVTLAELNWVYNTLNDPQFTTTGLLLSAGPTWFRNESEFAPFTGENAPVLTRTSTQAGGALRAEHYWQTGERGALFGRFRGTQTEIEQEGGLSASPSIDYRTADVSVGYGRNFGALLDQHGKWRARVEVGGGWTYYRSESAGQSRSEDDPYLTVGESFRHPWGQVKITAMYLPD